MRAKGITSERRIKAYKGLLSIIAYFGGTPLGLGSLSSNAPINRLVEKGLELEDAVRREDAWRLYLGLPQLGGTFSVSEHVPSRSGDPLGEYFQINDFPRKLAEHAARFGGLRLLADNIRRFESQDKPYIIRDNFTQVMGEFQLSTGEDELGSYIAYYDIWDLNARVAVERLVRSAGAPYEIYGRVYYDSEGNLRLPHGRF